MLLQIKPKTGLEWYNNKKGECDITFPFLLSAEGGTRTHMPSRAHAPETCVSTNFTTSAYSNSHHGISV